MIPAKKFHKKYNLVKQMQREREILRAKIKNINQQISVKTNEKLKLETDNHNSSYSHFKLVKEIEKLETDRDFYEKTIHFYKRKISNFFKKYNEQVVLFVKNKRKLKNERKQLKQIADKIEENRFAIDSLEVKRKMLRQEMQVHIVYDNFDRMQRIQNNIKIRRYIRSLDSLYSSVIIDIINISREQKELKNKFKQLQKVVC
jgi:hypothetical protein